VLVLRGAAFAAMVAHCLDDFPLEACGLVIGTPEAIGGGGGARAVRCEPARNAAASARVYSVEPRDLLKADRLAESLGAELIGVYHSHTHTDAYPSPTDVSAVPDPGWHYVLVSLRDTEPAVRSYRIHDGRIEEEAVLLEAEGGVLEC
jgi:[CysO sulfur-carrier protein]-S-L-cysteine hydrolase